MKQNDFYKQETAGEQTGNIPGCPVGMVEKLVAAAQALDDQLFAGFEIVDDAMPLCNRSQFPV